MKVLVTGATGFLGKYVLEELSSANYQVMAFGRNAAIGQTLENENVTFFKGDFVTLSDIMTATRDVDIVIHCGALSTVWGKWEDFYQTNVIGTKNVLAACESNQVQKLVYISSPSVYAACQDFFEIKEEEYDRKNELNFYIKSKLMAEACIQKNQQVKSVILRPRGLFGVGDTSIIPRLLQINNKIGLPLFKKGKHIVDLTCVENVALAIRLSIESEQAIGKIYNITNGEPQEFKAILEQLMVEIGQKPKYLHLNFGLMYGLASLLEFIYKTFHIYQEPMITKYTLSLLRYSQTLNIEKAKKDLGYVPIMTLAEGIKKYAAYDQKH